ncbi:hypothetical protein V7128_07285 [Neobacillus vireti]|uniref:hypothetical protein n=1 Tax=Neobacillus vireti TaxID=220686 RepID=UPI0030002BCA
MARFNMRVDFVDNSRLLERKVKSAMKDAVLDVTLDMKRVASASAPHDTGFLEKSAQHEVFVTNQSVEGTVGFSAVHDGFDYARWTHDEEYNLGEKSARKRGGKSRFGNGGTVPVGKGYLENALEMNKQGYLQYLEQKYKESLS